MNIRRFTTHFHLAIAAGALTALSAAAPAQAVDQGAWLQEQLAASDGGSYPSFVPSEKSTRAYETDAQSAWLQGQLAISDGSVPFNVSGANQAYAGAPHPSDGLSNKQFAFVEHGLRQSDGCNE